MSKYLFFIAIVLCSASYSYAQENVNMIKVLNIKKDLHSVEKKISKQINENPDIAKTKNLRQFHILDLEIEDDILTKEDYLNYSFLHHLYPCRMEKYVLYSVGSIEKKKNYIFTYTLITDSKGNPVAFGDAHYIQSTSSYNNFGTYYAYMAKLFLDKEIDFAFRIASIRDQHQYTILIKGDNLYAFGWDYNTDDFVKYTWEEFMECCFDDWINSKR
jgi:hypothetical protein